jgi:hypothetical protein
MTFNRPSELLYKESTFGIREPGITHPDNDAFFKIADNGDMYAMGNGSTGIIVSPSQDTVFIIANKVKVVTKEDEGFRWNNLAFNPKGVTYSEPAFIYPKDHSGGSIYDGISYFVD